jgi:hypothetical protein
VAHFAQVDGNNVVRNVIVVDNSDLGTRDFPYSEATGLLYIHSLGLNGDWLQTSYNGNFRGQYAGQGMTYDPALDEFVSPQPAEAPSE